VDNEGFFIQLDGTRSRVVHQFEVFAAKGNFYLNHWLMKNHMWFDMVPTPFYRAVRKEQYEAQESPSDPSDSLPTSSRKVTDTGITLTDPELYESVDLNGDSSTATVISMATGYDLDTYELFVGSLRKSGYRGMIMLAVDVHTPPEVLKYFEYRNVTAKASILQDSLFLWSNTDFSHHLYVIFLLCVVC